MMNQVKLGISASRDAIFDDAADERGVEYTHTVGVTVCVTQYVVSAIVDGDSRVEIKELMVSRRWMKRVVAGREEEDVINKIDIYLYTNGRD